MLKREWKDKQLETGDSRKSVTGSKWRRKEKKMYSSACQRLVCQSLASPAGDLEVAEEKMVIMMVMMMMMMMIMVLQSTWIQCTSYQLIDGLLAGYLLGL